MCSIGVHNLNGIWHLLLALANEGNVIGKHEIPALADISDTPCIAFPEVSINFQIEFRSSLLEGWLETSSERVYEQVEQHWGCPNAASASPSLQPVVILSQLHLTLLFPFRAHCVFKCRSLSRFIRCGGTPFLSKICQARLRSMEPQACERSMKHVCGRQCLRMAHTGTSVQRLHHCNLGPSQSHSAHAAVAHLSKL